MRHAPARPSSPYRLPRFRSTRRTRAGATCGRPLGLEPLENRLLLTYSAVLTVGVFSTFVTFTGDAAGDNLIFDVDPSGNLRHNRASAGDGGFASDIDLDSSQPGEQSLPVNQIHDVIVNAGGGDDIIHLVITTAPSGFLDQTHFAVNGQAGSDILKYDDTGDTPAVGCDNPTQLGILTATTFGSATFDLINYSTVETFFIEAGDCPALLRVDGSADGTLVIVNDSTADDTIIVNGVGAAGIQIDGGEGSDTAVVNFGSLAGPVKVQDSGILGTDNLTVNGTTGDDTILVIGSDVKLGAQVVTDGGGIETLTVNGGKGRDVIDSTAAARIINLEGGGGGDTLLGSGADRIFETGNVDFTLTDTSLTGKGRDQFSGIAEAVLRLTDPRVAAAVGSRGALRIESASAIGASTSSTPGAMIDASRFSGKVTMFGNSAGNMLIGGGGDDAMDAGAGDDTLIGGPGNDIMAGGAGDDSLSGGEGNDLLSGGDGRDQLDDTLGDNELDAGAGCDQIDGSFEYNCFLNGRVVYRADRSLAAGVADYFDYQARKGVTTFELVTPGTNFELEITDSAGHVVPVDGFPGMLRADIATDARDGERYQVRVFSPTGGGGPYQLKLTGAIKNRLGNLFIASGGGDDDILVGRNADDEPTGNIADIRIRGRSDSYPETRYTPELLDALLGPLPGLLIKGGGGNDLITIDPSVTAPVVLKGLNGDDSLLGGSGNDILDGGNGSDSCTGGLGTNVVVNCEVMAAAAGDRAFVPPGDNRPATASRALGASNTPEARVAELSDAVLGDSYGLAPDRSAISHRPAAGVLLPHAVPASAVDAILAESVEDSVPLGNPRA